MNWQNLVSRLKKAKEVNRDFVRIRNDEIDSLMQSVRCLANLNNQHRKKIIKLEDELTAIKEHFLEVDTLLNQKTQIISALEAELLEESNFNGDDEMDCWYSGIVKQAKQKQRLNA